MVKVYSFNNLEIQQHQVPKYILYITIGFSIGYLLIPFLTSFSVVQYYINVKSSLKKNGIFDIVNEL